jgi:glycerophosphoryl diester phosphodiesterase
MKPLVVGHRGAMALAPENTMASFRRAAALGADAVKCDVHLSRDGRLVVIHDGTLDRTTSGKGAVQARAWADLSRLDAGAWFGPRFRGERLPSLDGLLSWARRAGLHVVVEAKNDGGRTPRMAEAVVAALRRADMTERVLVISFHHETVRRVKALAPRVLTGILFDKPLARPAERLAWSGADALFPRHTLVTPALLAAARRAGVLVGTWTVNRPADMARLARLGVDAVTSNDPGELRRRIGR